MANLWDYLNAVNDATKAFGSGAVTSASHIFGVPGELASGVRTASNALFDQIDSGLGYQHSPTTPARPLYDILPNKQEADNLARQYITGPAYRPQTAFGHGAQAIGENLPALLLAHLAGASALRGVGGPLAEFMGPAIQSPEAGLMMAGSASALPAAVAANQNVNTDFAPSWLKGLLTNPAGGGVSSAY